MAKHMFVNVVNEEESRIAILEDGHLEELSIETARDELIEGNIYKAKIEKVVPGLDAVFVDYGREKNGFIAMSEIRSEYFTNSERKPDNLKRGREMIVQVKKGEIGNKGAALTTYVSLPGRYLVLMPHLDKRGVSRQIQSDAKRKALLEAISETSISDDMGFIVRTAAEDQTKQDIQRDVNFLLRLWKRVSTLYNKAKGPSLLYREGDLVIRTIRDYFSPDIKEVLVDDAKVHERVLAFFRSVMPWHAKKVKFYEGRAPLFSKYNLEAQIATIHEDKVKLPSGGSIVIQQTEALVSVDVNSGAGSKNKDIEATALQTNLEAAAETARQLRLRDLGGLIVIDFIDMRPSANRTAVKKELQKAIKKDKAQSDVGTISKFGLLELSRQRLRRASSPKISTSCPTCGGSGKLRSTDSFALLVMRIVHSVLAKNNAVRKVRVGVPADTAAFLFNKKRNKISEFEERFGTSIEVFAETELSANRYYIEFIGAKVRVETNLDSNVPTEGLRCRNVIEATPEEPYMGVSYDSLDDDGEHEEIPEVPEEPRDEPREEPSAEEGAASGGVETVDDTDEDGDADKPKRRRRRRRRRRRKSSGNGENGENAASDGNGNAPAQNQDGQEDERAPEAKPAPTGGDTPAPSQPVSPAGVSDEEEVKAEGEAKKKTSRRRPRRRSRSKAAAASEQSAAQGTTGGVMEDQPAIGPAPSPGTPTPSTSARQEEPGVAQGNTAAPAAVGGDAAVTAEENPPAAEPEKKKPAARRPRRRATSAAKSQGDTPAKADTQVDDGAQKAEPESKPARKPARRSSARTAAKSAAKTEPEASDKVEGKTDEKPNEAGEAKPAKKPAARRPRRKAATTKKAQGEDSAGVEAKAASSEPETDAATAAEKPKKPAARRPRRKAAAKKDDEGNAE